MIRSNNQIFIDKMRLSMESIKERFSPTICTAKWLQISLYLHNGSNCSCHHPPSHRILLDDIKNNPSALHNTKYKKQQRAMMLCGKRPPECQYCWNIEDLGKDYISDRIYKSTDTYWSIPFLNRITMDDINPSYLEVAFDNTCDFRCMYCSPPVSSAWMKEVEQYGIYPTSTRVGSFTPEQNPISAKDYNPYIEAFWKWWPELYPDLSTFRITGGEPLLSKHTWRLLKFINENPRKDINIAVNTHMQPSDKLLDKFIDYYNRIVPNINKFTIFTSCDTYGKQAEYIRYGMNYKKFMSNVRKFLSETSTRLTFTITFNALSIFGFTKFLNDILDLRAEFNSSNDYNRVGMMIPYLSHPDFQGVHILPIHLKNKYTKIIKDFIMLHAINKNPHKVGGFYLEEIDQINRLCGYIYKEDMSQNKRMVDDFISFYREYDIRKGLDFTKTFPEIEFKR